MHEQNKRQPHLLVNDISVNQFNFVTFIDPLLMLICYRTD